MGVILWSRSEEVTTQLNNQTKNKHIMKAFAPVLMALVAGAKAEADPQYLTAYGGLYGGVRSVIPSTYGGYYGGVRSVIPSTYGYAYNPYNRVVALGKREAEAEPEADAQLLYGNRFGYSGLGYNTWGLNAYNTYNPYNRVVALGKREAEADPQLLLNGWGVSPYTYGHVAAVSPYTHAAVAAPLAAAKPSVGTYTNDAAKFTPAYAMKGQYVAQNAGAVHVAKREAEAEPEADAQLLYTNRFGYAGLGYNTWGSYGAYTPYNRVVALGKREAEADPALIYNTNVWGASPYAYSAGYPWASSVYGINRFY